ncbi:hypothetical protein [Paenibacillus tepidiphilus]|uniref:hypothetical protein n=1 Tax=Paenibacillus tepidiphilus TaxID=2608683 RepID=UPI00123B61A1|nr:hypothetical protein [Paenibacillus tepidiphilus]
MPEWVKLWLRREFLYMLLLTLLMIVLALAAQRINPGIAVLVLAAGVAMSVWLWKQELSVKVLYRHNVLNVVCALALAVLIPALLKIDLSGYLSILSAVIVADMLSFLRIGRRTPNAKLMGNRQSLARLSICLPLPGRPGLTPIIGVGDLMFYALLTLAALQFPQALHPWIALPLVVLGQLLDIVLIVAAERRKGYKGFPATLMPGVLFIILIAANLP